MKRSVYLIYLTEIAIKLIMPPAVFICHCKNNLLIRFLQCKVIDLIPYEKFLANLIKLLNAESFSQHEHGYKTFPRTLPSKVMVNRNAYLFKQKRWTISLYLRIRPQPLLFIYCLIDSKAFCWGRWSKRREFHPLSILSFQLLDYFPLPLHIFYQTRK